MAPIFFHEIEYLVFILTFWRKKHFSRSDQFSLLIYHCLNLSSATVKMENEENMETARYAPNDDTPL